MKCERDDGMLVRGGDVTVVLIIHPVMETIFPTLSPTERPSSQYRLNVLGVSALRPLGTSPNRQVQLQ